MKNLTHKALKIATEAHAGQYRRDGITPYIEHPKAVAERVEHLGDEYICVAYLHDVLEDGDEESYLQKLYAEFPIEIVDAVVLLTRQKDMTYESYITNIKNNELARQVKVADMLSNLADNPTDKQIKKYEKGLLYLLTPKHMVADKK